MPIAPDIEPFDPNATFNLSEVHYGAPIQFVSAFQNQLGEMATQEVVNNFIPKKNEFFDIGNFKPDSPRTTQEDVDELVKDRPGLDIPIGIHPQVAEMLTKRYDDQQNFQFIAEHNPTVLGKIAAFGGSTTASLLDLKSLLIGGAAGKTAGIAYESIAAGFARRMAAKEIVGSEASNLGTRVLQSGVETGAGFGGFQGAVEVRNQEERARLGQDSTYLQSLQNIGEATGLGATFGVVGTALLKPAFDHITPQVKSVVSKYYKPWSKESDVTAREDSVGQAYNGQEPDISLTLRQGQIDEAVNFRNVLKENNIDLNELDQSLVKAQENITNEIFSGDLSIKLNKQGKEKREIQTDFYRSIDRIPSPTGSKKSNEYTVEIPNKKGVLEMDLVNNKNDFMVFNSVVQDELLGKGIGKALYRRAINEALKLNKGFQSDSAVSDSAMRVYKSLEKEGYKFERNPNVERKKMAGSDFYGSPEEWQTYSLDKNAPVMKLISAPENAKLKLQIAEKQKRIDDLTQQYQLAQSLRDHINDTYKPLTQDEMKSYSDRLSSIDIPDTGMEIAPTEDINIDESLKQYDDSQVNSLLERPGFEELKMEFDNVRSLLGKQEKYAEMANNMVNCILKGLF